VKIWQVLKKSTSQSYDKLFKFGILNLLWFFLSTIVVYIGYYGLFLRAYYLLIIPIILLGPFFMGGLMVSIDYLKFNDFIIKKYFTYIKENFKRGLVGFLFTFFIYIILFVDFVFFLRKGSDSIFMLVLAVLILYIIIFFSMMQCTYWGYLALKRDLGIKDIIKNSFLTTIDNLIFTFLWFIIVFILSSILIISGFGIALLLMNFVSLMILNATIEISSKYEKIEIGELSKDE